MNSRASFVVLVTSKKLSPHTKKPLRWCYILSEPAASEAVKHWQTRPGIAGVEKRPMKSSRRGAAA